MTLLILYLRRGERENHDAIPLKGLMLLHIGWTICSTFYSLSVATSAKQLISQVLEYYLLYFLLVRTITSVRTIHRIVFAMMMAIGVCCLFSLLEVYATWSILRIFPQKLWITYNGGIDPIYIEWGRGLRVRSTFPHPILFGDALAMSIPLTLYLLSVWERQYQRILLWMSLGLMFWAIYKTSSRGPWIATGMCSMLLFVLIRNEIRKYLLAIVVVTVVALLARPGIWSTIAGLYSASTDPTSPVGSSYLYRDALNQAVRNAVDKDPTRALLGYGLGTFRELGLDITFFNSVHRWFTCDNNWAAFLYETGYVGLMIIGALLARTLIIAFKNYRHLPAPDNYLSGVIFIALGGFYFLLLSVAGYSWGQQGYMAWILISLVVSHSRVAPEGFEESEDDDVEESQSHYELHAA
ncbi:O-antigen ligase family protein [Granulicella sp. dw_53]|uniref:O-antigen ligase family protein n=1 Tax=Granulicella sp. dw_53 TaxID=2719792 RepID=UPI001BD67DD6|nr:O-antigen ligase family protein [Granulicella sp. dw_53]